MTTLVCGREVKLPNPNDKDVLTYIRDFLIQQGRKSEGLVEEEIKCCYRAENNTLACGVGCLIPDDEYNYIMENQSLQFNIIETSLKNHGYKNLFVLKVAQMIHDHIPVEYWKVCFNQMINYVNFNKPSSDVPF